MVTVRSFAILLLCASCAAAQAGSAEAEIRATRDRFNQAIVAHDLAGVTRALAPDVELVAGNGGHTSGGEAELNLWRDTFADPAFVDYVRTPDSVTVSTAVPRAAEHGHWVGHHKFPEGTRTYSGEYLAQWFRTPDGWQLRAELYVTLACSGPRCPAR